MNVCIYTLFTQLRGILNLHQSLLNDLWFTLLIANISPEKLMLESWFISFWKWFPFPMTFVYVLVSIGKLWLFALYRGWNHTQVYLAIISEAILRIPINQPGFNGMSLVGFHHCSCKNIILIIINYDISNVKVCKNLTIFVVLFHLTIIKM